MAKKVKKKPRIVTKKPKGKGVRWLIKGVDFSFTYVTVKKYLTAEEAIWEDGVQNVISMGERFTVTEYVPK